jgi:hypothetical protein
MSTVKTKSQASLQAAQTRKTLLDSQLAANNYSTDLVAVIVPVHYVTTVQKAPGSAMTDQQARDLAVSLGLELYEP